MPNDSQFTDKIVRFMRTSKKPVTATEIQEAVGLSRQGAYYWLRGAGQHLVQPIGQGRNSATAYVLREDAGQYPANFKPHAMWTVSGRGRAKERRPNFRLGAMFAVKSMRIEEGHALVELEDIAEGVAFTVNVGPQ